MDKHNHPEEINSNDFMRSKLNYIHENPVRAGWVEKPEEYLFKRIKLHKRQWNYGDRLFILNRRRR